MHKLIIVDDHAMLREGISSWFARNTSWEILLLCDGMPQLQEQLPSADIAPGDKVVAIVDLSYKADAKNIECMNGWSIIKWLRERNISSVVFSSHDSGSTIEKAMSPEIGARGFVSKCSEERMLLDAVNTVAEGRTYIQPDLFSGLMEIRSLLSALSPKERKIIDLMLQNLNNDEIAERMGIKVRTVENYVTRIYDKTGADNRLNLLKRFK